MSKLEGLLSCLVADLLGLSLLVMAKATSTWVLDAEHHCHLSRVSENFISPTFTELISLPKVTWRRHLGKTYYNNNSNSSRTITLVINGTVTLVRNRLILGGRCMCVYAYVCVLCVWVCVYICVCCICVSVLYMCMCVSVSMYVSECVYVCVSMCVRVYVSLCVY